MIDMHSHILFGVDDGAKTIIDSINLIKQEASKGVSHIIVTPHYKKRLVNYNFDSVDENFKQLKEMVLCENIGVELYLGSEVYLGADFHEVLCNDSIYTLAGSDYILMEFSELNTPKNIPEICYEARLKGYIPVIAHVERYELVLNNNKLVEEILNEGAHLQINASSVVLRDNKEAYKFVNFLLKNELVSFVASDVHNMDSRRFYLDEAYKSVSKICNQSYTDKIFKINQQNIITNKYFDSPKFHYEKKGLLSRLFR